MLMLIIMDISVGGGSEDAPTVGAKLGTILPIVGGTGVKLGASLEDEVGARVTTTDGGVVKTGSIVGGSVNADGAADPVTLGEGVGMGEGANGQNSRKGGARSLFPGMPKFQ